MSRHVEHHTVDLVMMIYEPVEAECMERVAKKLVEGLEIAPDLTLAVRELTVTSQGHRHKNVLAYGKETIGDALAELGGERLRKLYAEDSDFQQAIFRLIQQGLQLFPPRKQ